MVKSVVRPPSPEPAWLSQVDARTLDQFPEIGVIVVDREGIVRRWSAGVERWGRRREEVLEKPTYYLNLISKAERNTREALLKRVFDTGEEMTFEGDYRSERRGLRHQHVRAIPLRDPETGRVEGVMLKIEDRTDQAQALDEGRRILLGLDINQTIDAMLHAAVSLTSSKMAEVRELQGSGDVITRWNVGFGGLAEERKKTSGRSQVLSGVEEDSSVVLNSPAEMRVAGVRPENIEKYGLTRMMIYRFSAPVIDQAGKASGRRHFALIAYNKEVPYTPEDAHRLRMMGIYSGIALANAGLYEQVNRQRESAEASARVQATLASTLAHDVINPSIGMASLAQGDIDFTQHYLGGDGRIPPDEVLRVVSHFQDFARIVQDHASGVERLAADMMKSISAGRLVLAPRTISVHDVVSGIQRPLEERAKTAGIKLSVDVPADLPQVIADEPKTEQIIQNLVGNAFKFTDRGGTVKVVARPVGREEVVVRVEDTGRGIPPDKQLTVFEPRVQVSPEDSQRGYGLGLAIVKRLVEVQGGRIELASTVGVGSTFSFTLPVVDSPKAKEILGQKDFIDLRQMLGKFDRGQKEGFLMKRFGVNAEVAVPASELLIGVEDNQQNWEAIEKVMIDLFKSKDRFGIPAGGRILLSAGVENGSPFVRMEVARQRPEKPVDDITGRWRHNLSGIQSSIEVEESDTEFSATIRLPRI